MIEPESGDDVVWVADYIEQKALDEFIEQTDADDITAASIDPSYDSVLKLDLMRLKGINVKLFSELVRQFRFHTVAGLAEALSIVIVSNSGKNDIKCLDINIGTSKPPQSIYHQYRTWGRSDFERAVCKDCHAFYASVTGHGITSLWHMKHSNLNKIIAPNSKLAVSTSGVKKPCCGQ
jgi:hypothetical protein